MAVMWVAAINLMARAISESGFVGQARESTLVADRRAACSSRAGSHHDLARPWRGVGDGYSATTLHIDRLAVGGRDRC
jgi:hypothetical protein